MTQSRQNVTRWIVLGLAGVFTVAASVWCVLSGARRKPGVPPTAQLAPSRSVRSPPSLSGVAPTRIAPGSLRLEGQVVDEELHPLAEVEVAVEDTDRATTSAADGSFALERLPAGHYRLSVSADGFYADPIVARLTPTSPPVIIRMRPGATAAIRIVNASDGAPIGGASVLHGRYRVTAGSDGVARVRGIRPGYDSLRITAQGYADAGLMLGTADDPTATIERTVKLHRGASLSGVVLGPDERPVPDAEVTISAFAPSWHGTARTDAAGAWHVDALAAGRHLLHASSAEHTALPDVSVALDGIHPLAGVVVRVVSGGEIVGEVVDRAGKTVAGAEIVAQREMGRGHTAVSDASGHFAIRGTSLDALELYAHRGTQASPIELIHFDKASRIELRLVLQEASIAGIVVDSRGQPVAEARVVARQAVRFAHHQEVSDAKGEFSFDGLPPGAWDLFANRAEDGGRLGEPTPAKSGDRHIRLVLPELSAITGRVLLDNQPVTYFGLLLSEYPEFSWQDAATAIRSTDGRFTKSKVVPKTWNLVLTGPDFARKIVPNVVVEEGKVTDLGDVHVDRGRHVEGIVTDANGTPVAGVNVVVSPNLPVPSGDDLLRQIDRGKRSTVSDDRGAYRIDGLASPDQEHGARWYVSASHPTQGVAARVELPDADAKVDLRLLATGDIHGRVVGDYDQYYAVQASSVGDWSFTTAALEPGGNFTFSGLTPGEYYVRLFTVKRSHSAFAQVRVVEGQSADLTITLEPTVTVVVRVSDPGCDFVVLRNADRKDFHGETCSANEATLDNIRPGSYTLCPDANACTPVIVQASPPRQIVQIEATQRK